MKRATIRTISASRFLLAMGNPRRSSVLISPRLISQVKAAWFERHHSLRENQNINSLIRKVLREWLAWENIR